jgi:hypothetical protein
MFSNSIEIKATNARVARFERAVVVYCQALESAPKHPDFEIEGRVTGIERRMLSTRVTYLVEYRSSSKSLVEGVTNDLLKIGAAF